MVQRARGAEAKRSSTDGFGGNAAHLGDLGGAGGFAIGAALAHHIEAQGAVRNLCRNIDVVRATLDLVEVLGEALPLPAQTFVQRCARNVFDAFHEFDEPLAIAFSNGSESDATVAHDNGGDTVIGRWRKVAIPRGLAVVVSVNVDKARGDQCSVGIDHSRGIALNIANLHHNAVAHGDIGDAAGFSRAIEHEATADNEIELGHAPS